MPDEKIPMSKTPVPEEDSSNLQVLKRQLYAREESEELKDRQEKLGDLPAQRGEGFGIPRVDTKATFTDALARRTKAHRQALRWGIIAVGIVLVFVAAAAGTLWYRSAHQVRDSQVGLTITAPDQFTSGESITYIVEIENKSLENWEQVQVKFEAPLGFQLTSSQPSQLSKDGPAYAYNADTLAAGEKRQVSFIGKLVGEQDASLLSKASVTFTPVNDPRGLRTSTTTLTTTIRAVPLEVSIEASQNAVSGERLLGIIHVKNISSLPQENVYLALQVPPGMQLSTSDPQFSADFSVPDTRWNLPPLKPLDEAVRNIVFYVDGATGENRSLGVEVGVKNDDHAFVQRTLSHVVSIAGSELSIDQQYDGKSGDKVVVAGQKVSGVIKFRNTGTTGLKSVVVTLKFEGVGLDPSKLQLRGGAYNPTNKTITWTSATVPALAVVAANQTGEIPFDFSILPTAQFPTSINNAIIATASIDSPDIITPLGQERRIVSQRTTFSVASDLSLETIAFYDDGRLGLPSDGPLPPTVGEQTSYTLRFRLGSTLNDAGDVKLVAVLPDGVAYTGKIYKTTGEVGYNERTGEVVWTIPLIKALTGRTTPSEELHVQVAITPGENKRGSDIPLLQSVKAEATDQFVDQSISTTVDRLPDTESAAPGKGKVQ